MSNSALRAALWPQSAEPEAQPPYEPQALPSKLEILGVSSGREIGNPLQNYFIGICQHVLFFNLDNRGRGRTVHSAHNNVVS